MVKLNKVINSVQLKFINNDKLFKDVDASLSFQKDCIQCLKEVNGHFLFFFPFKSCSFAILSVVATKCIKLL